MGESDSALLLMMILILLEAFITVIDEGIQMVNESNVRKNAENGDRKSILLLQIIEKPSRYLNVIEFILTGAIALNGFFFARALYKGLIPLIQEFFSGDRIQLIQGLFIVVTWLVMIFIVTLLGRVLPSKIGLKYSETIAYKTAGTIHRISMIFYPVSAILDICTRGLLFLLHINPDDLEERVTEDEIRSIVNVGQEKGIIDSNEAEMIANIMELDKIDVADIMTHRKKVVAIDTNLSIEAAVKYMSGERYSRYPLYDDDIDNVIGIIHLKDAMRYYISEKDRNKPLSDIARDPYFVPETQRIDVLFKDMQSKKIHMAVAVDEYGQTAGIVAMEDILEEIVGNIFDEYDEEEKFIVDQGKGKYLIKGLANLEEIEEKLDIEFDQEDYDTLNGFLISMLDRIPADGEKAMVKYKGYLFQIMYVKDKIIRYVKVYPDKQED